MAAKVSERDNAARHASELTDQVEAMDDAICLLMCVVAILSDDGDGNRDRGEDGVETQLHPGRSRSCDNEGDNARENEESSHCPLTHDDGMAFDDLQWRWKLEQATFPSLYNTCKTLRRSRHLLAQEADRAQEGGVPAEDSTIALATARR